MHRNKIKHIIFIFFVVVLFLPLIQQLYPIIKFKPLLGKFEVATKPALNYNELFQGSYQPKLEKYINDHIGYRNLFIRLFNQVRYKFMNTSNAEGAKIGTDGYLYQEEYILSYLGKDFVHPTIINRNIYKLKLLQDTLQKLDKDILVVLAPGKGSFYPNNFPLIYRQKSKTTSNYDLYQDLLVKNGINTIDFRSWFHSIKDTSSYTLMTKNGIHCSKYSESLVADSLIKYISKQFNVSLPTIKVNKIVRTNIPQSSDNDILQTMNLLCEPSDLPLFYPEIEIVKNPNQKRTIKPIVIADSYFYGLFEMGLINDIMTQGEYWFYFNRIENRRKDKKTKPQELNLREEVDKKDLIILYSTDMNLKYLGFGAIDKLYEFYFGKDETLSDMQFKHLDRILRDTKWIMYLNKKALIYNKPFDTILKGDLEYLINVELYNKQ
ncbi:MAG: hypothetical protein PHX48_07530 [Bacteroidales bacterium]|nr:hypothetical protein [Bacteroidales bacterium]